MRRPHRRANKHRCIAWPESGCRVRVERTVVSPRRLYSFSWDCSLERPAFYRLPPKTPKLKSVRPREWAKPVCDGLLVNTQNLMESWRARPARRSSYRRLPEKCGDSTGLRRPATLSARFNHEHRDVVRCAGVESGLDEAVDGCANVLVLQPDFDLGIGQRVRKAVRAQEE